MGRKKLPEEKRKVQLVVRANIERGIIKSIPKYILADVYKRVSLDYERQILALYEKYKN